MPQSLCSLPYIPSCNATRNNLNKMVCSFPAPIPKMTINYPENIVTKAQLPLIFAVPAFEASRSFGFIFLLLHICAWHMNDRLSGETGFSFCCNQGLFCNPSVSVCQDNKPSIPRVAYNLLLGGRGRGSDLRMCLMNLSFTSCLNILHCIPITKLNSFPDVAFYMHTNCKLFEKYKHISQ